MSNILNLLNSPTGVFKTLFGKKLIVAFSGGKDSLALLDYLWVHRDSGGYTVLACHVNHNLRGDEALKDEQFCESWCSANGIPFVCLTVNASSDMRARGVENFARDERYRLLHELRLKLDYDYIVTAHTLDDQLESFFVDLLTGVSLFTLGGIEENSGERVVRPMLHVSTDMVNEYLLSRNLTPRFDSSNADMRYVRNNVRANLMPVLNKFDKNALVGSIFGIQDSSRLLDDYFERKIGHLADYNAFEKAVSISFDDFALLDIVEQRYLLGKWLSVLCRGGKVHLDYALSRLNGKNVRISMPSRYNFELSAGVITLYPACFTAPFSVRKERGTRELEIPGWRCLLFADKWIDKDIVIRNRRDGDIYRGVLLKKRFANKKIDLYKRDRALLLVENGEIIGVEYLDKLDEIFSVKLLLAK